MSNKRHADLDDQYDDEHQVGTGAQSSASSKRHRSDSDESVDPFIVTQWIVKPNVVDSNLCMFYALFNALRDSRLRVVFAGGASADEIACGLCWWGIS